VLAWKPKPRNKLPPHRTDKIILLCFVLTFNCSDQLAEEIDQEQEESVAAPQDAEEHPSADAEEHPSADAEEHPSADAEEHPSANAEEHPSADAEKNEANEPVVDMAEQAEYATNVSWMLHSESSRFLSLGVCLEKTSQWLSPSL